MNTSVNTDDVIFNFFKQICDEKDDQKCIELGNSWINAMETNLTKMEINLNDQDKIKYKEDIQNKNNNEIKKWAYKVNLKSGIILYIPPGWYYFFESEGETIMNRTYNDNYFTWFYNYLR